jgi:hypothetical protein
LFHITWQVRILSSLPLAGWFDTCLRRIIFLSCSLDSWPYSPP